MHPTRPFDPEKMHKLAAEARFFDVNDCWYPANDRVVRWLYTKPVSANQITVLSLLLGMAAAGCYLLPGMLGLIPGALLLYGKVYLDNVDGNLARARGEVSRFGRFFDSLTDFLVSLVVYAALSHHLAAASGDAFYWALGAIAFLSCLLHCSYFVFYLVSYTSRVGSYAMNRVHETVTSADQKAKEAGALSGGSFFLQRLHGVLYGWQDSLIAILDRFSLRLAGGLRWSAEAMEWYADKRFLSLSSPLCLCTNNTLLVVFSLLGRPEWAFFAIIYLGNGYLAGLQFWKVFKQRAAPV